jgi:hypothetical protein
MHSASASCSAGAAPVEEIRPGDVEWLEHVTDEQYGGK